MWLGLIRNFFAFIVISLATVVANWLVRWLEVRLPDPRAPIPIPAPRVESEVIVVDLVDGVQIEELEADYPGLDLTWTSSLDSARGEGLAFAPVDSPEAWIERLGRDPRVEVAEPQALYRMLEVPSDLAGEPNDPLYVNQWNMKLIGAPAGWARGAGAGSKVAVLDTGVTPGKDLSRVRAVSALNDDGGDRQGHGTHVIGTIVQTTNNGYGAVGVAPNAEVISIKVLSDDGYGQSDWIAAGIMEAIQQDVDVISMSLGGSGSAVIERAVAEACNAGILVIAAAGNSGSNSVHYPAAYPCVMAVGATGPEDKIAPYSTWGDFVDISAPGGDTRVTNGGILQETLGGFKAYQGTSMATPHVAGAAAILAGQGLSAKEIERALLESAVDLGEPGWDPYFGHGRLSIGRAEVVGYVANYGVISLVTVLFTAALGFLARTKLSDLFNVGLGGVAIGLSGAVVNLVAPFLPYALPAWLLRPIPSWFSGLPEWAWGSALVPFAILTVIGPTKMQKGAAALSLAWGTAAYLRAWDGSDSYWVFGYWLANAITCGLLTVGSLVISDNAKE